MTRRKQIPQPRLCRLDPPHLTEMFLVFHGNRKTADAHCTVHYYGATQHEDTVLPLTCVNLDGHSHGEENWFFDALSAEEQGNYLKSLVNQLGLCIHRVVITINGDNDNTRGCGPEDFGLNDIETSATRRVDGRSMSQSACDTLPK